jgi:pentatricopeptide repeat protein
MRRVRLNKDITQHARRKDLAAARRCFEEAERALIANNYTYSCTISAYVRCGEVDGALALLRRMAQRCATPPSVVEYTTVLKGLCGEGRMRAADAVLREMETGGVGGAGGALPNVRTANTYLRGCLLTGEVVEAVACFAKLGRAEAWPRAVADSSSYEYTITLLCHALRIEEARERLRELATLPAVAVSSVGAAALSIARAAALRAQWGIAEEMITRALSATDESGSSSGSGSGASAHTGPVSARAVAAAAATRGGKRAWSQTADESRFQSNEIFSAHRRDRMRTEALALRRFCARRVAPPRCAAISAKARRGVRVAAAGALALGEAGATLPPAVAARRGWRARLGSGCAMRRHSQSRCFRLPRRTRSPTRTHAGGCRWRAESAMPRPQPPPRSVRHLR